MSDEKPEIGGKSPAVLELAPGDYWWCTCGKSSKQPFCDGSHKGTSFTPEKIQITEKKNYALCTCKQSGNGAFCDGAHTKL
jgi:CDGSH-type Zn-finger protein